MVKVLVLLIQVFRALRKGSIFFTVIQIGKEGKKKETLDEVVFTDNLTDEQNKTLHSINTFRVLKFSTK